MSFKIAFVVICVAVTAISASDYCKICSNHVACNNNGQLSPSCSPNAGVEEISPEVRQRILDQHNLLRNQHAKGETEGYPTANRMATMKWDDELAMLAELNTLRCEFKHDDCWDTERFGYAGQNIALYTSTKEPLDKFVTDRINSWFNEYKICDKDAIKAFHNNRDGKDNGHFTQVVRDQAFAVGCAIAKFNYKGSLSRYLVCNYAVTNIFEWPVYDEGKPASACKSGTNPNYDALCSENEVYDTIFFKN